jgi:asparagine synthase (glutamine-hydrolysing)
MLNIYNINSFKEYFNSNKCFINGDDTGNTLTYIYINDETLITSKNEKDFFRYVKKNEELKFQKKMFSYLLLNNVVPYPCTIYDNIYILSYGDMLKIGIMGKKFEFEFEFKFPYYQDNSTGESIPSTKILLEKISKSVDENIGDDDILSLSSGKDSTSILLGLAECGKKIDTFTYKSTNKSDETEYTSIITKKYGFKNIILELKEDSSFFTRNFDEFYSTINFPSVDQAQLSYLNFDKIIFSDKNIVDGSGSDIYIGHIPTKEQYYLNYFSLVNFSNRFISKQHKNNFPKNKAQGFLYKSISANNGLYTWFTLPEINSFFEEGFDTSNFWKSYENEYSNRSNYVDYRAMTRGRFLDSEVFMRKIRNVAYNSNSNVVFPWLDNDLISYWFNLPVKNKYNLKKFKNKILLRELLDEKLSYKLPKYGFDFNLVSFLTIHKGLVINEIITCKLFSKNIINTINELYLLLNTKQEYIVKRKIQILFQISSFVNRHEESL